MIIASISGHVAVSELLIEWGADIEAKDKVRPFKTFIQYIKSVGIFNAVN